MLRKPFVPPKVVKRDAENEVPHESDVQSILLKKPCVFSKFQQSLPKTDHLPSVLVGPQDVWERTLKQEPTKTTATKATDCTAYFKVLYVKQEQYLKRKAQKTYLDGVLESCNSISWNLYSEEGKVVWQGRAKQVSGTGAPTAAKTAFRKLCHDKIGKRNAEADVDDEDDDEPVRFECGSWLAEVEQNLDPISFKSGSVFLKVSHQIESGSAGTSSLSRSFKPPVRLNTMGPSILPARVIKPLHDPNYIGAIVLNTNASLVGHSTGGCPVVVDPYLARSLRPHQQEGVRWLYRCMMEQHLRTSEGALSGCILADEMGLGKTLQVITLIWTLLRQGPDGKSAVQKAVVVTPSSLVMQWVKEVSKWLGAERLVARALVQNQEAQELLNDFKSRISGNYQRNGLLICSYETVRRYSEELRGSCDLLVCDEAHRLKSLGGNKTVDALLTLGARKRILLTGTPVQNNLQEFYALLSFIAPNVLDSPNVFKRVYSDPISRGRDRDATQNERDLGEARSREMTEKVTPYILRRTSDLLNKHLPPLTQLVLFCRPSRIQLHMYRSLLQECSTFDNSSSLAMITALRKVCNSPSLMTNEASDTLSNKGLDANWVQPNDPNSVVMASGKLLCLSSLLETIISAGQRCVVVSTSTSALDEIDTHICQPQGYSTVRIDGGTNVNERQAIVESFNFHGRGKVFMLSTRAGGAGLNLIGASNLILFDSDWNPAADLQAMARIWRDGQKRECTVYRLLTTGTIEEKVYQRQITKGDLAAATLASGGAIAGRQFSKDELKDLFCLRGLKEGQDCETRLLCEGLELQPLEWLDLDHFPDLFHMMSARPHLTAAGKVLRPLVADTILNPQSSIEADDAKGKDSGEKLSKSPPKCSIMSLIQKDLEADDDVDLDDIV